MKSRFRTIYMGIFIFVLFKFSCSSDADREETMEDVMEEMVHQEEESMDDPTDTNTDLDVISYIENNGIIRVEFEIVEGDLEWERGNTLNAFDGTGYLRSNKEDNFNIPRIGVLVYKLNFSTPGIYQFVLRSRFSEGDSQSVGNDSWLSFSDTSEFFGQGEVRAVFPNGLAITPVPKGSSSDGWFEIYMNRVGEYFWRSNTSDNDPYNIIIQFDIPDMYTMKVSGRSKFHAFHRFVLFLEGKTLIEAQDAERNAIVKS